MRRCVNACERLVIGRSTGRARKDGNDTNRLFAVQPRRRFERFHDLECAVERFLIRCEETDYRVGENRRRQSAELRYAGARINQKIVWVQLVSNPSLKVEHRHGKGRRVTPSFFAFA